MHAEKYVNIYQVSDGRLQDCWSSVIDFLNSKSYLYLLTMHFRHAILPEEEIQGVRIECIIISHSEENPNEAQG